MFSEAILAQATQVLALCRQQGFKIATAESCTGGLVAGALTEIAGSSDVVERGFVTYSNDAKTEMLAVPAILIREFGAVSAQVATAMAEGALQASHADMAVAITGIAGPGGGTATKPVGLVHFACARRWVPTRQVERRFGDIGRHAIRTAALVQALNLLLDMAQQSHQTP